MPTIPCTTVGFKPTFPAKKTISTTIAKLMWAAATVGVSPTAPSTRGRPLLELCWRMTMVAASLERFGVWWTRSAAYNRLDASEKTAISYFLGMTMAQLASADVLGVPSLVHLDRVLAALGRPSGKSRPDFLGVDPISNALSVAVEAKGRTNGLSDDVLTKAKTQAGLLPAVTGVAATMTVASLSYFAPMASGTKPTWLCRLEDPPPSRQTLTISRESLVALHYQPIIAAISQLPREQRGAFVRAPLPELDAWLWVPQAVVELNWQLAPRAGQRGLKTLGAQLGDSLQPLAEDGLLSERLEAFAANRPARMFHLGANAIGMELGDSWSDR